jgi:hypothetical protein
MNRLLVCAAVSVLLLLVGLPSAASQDASDELDRRIVVRNLADDFVAFWDSTRDLPTSERVSRFKVEVAPKFPAFYGSARWAGRYTEEEQDARIAAAIEAFPSIRDAYLRKVESFDLTLDESIRTFLVAFPDFEASSDIYLLHTLGELDGGLRSLEGQRHLLFGPDVMATSMIDARPMAFFQHELFHVYHATRFTSCAELWCALWREGLAVYISHEFNRDATPRELGLDFYAAVGPDGKPALTSGLIEAVRPNLGRSWAHLETVLTSTDRTEVLDHFQYSPDARSGLTPRRGYYLGYLLARRIGAGRSPQALAAMPADEVRPLIFAAVAELAREASHDPEGTSAGR